VGLHRDGVEIHPDSTFEFLCFAGKPTLTCLDGIVLVMSLAVRDLIFLIHAVSNDQPGPNHTSFPSPDPVVAAWRSGVAI